MRDGTGCDRERDEKHGRRARFYALTAAGRAQLDEEVGHWTRLSRGVARIIDATV